LSYEEQLKIKQDVVRKAFANFSQLDASLVPAIGPTLPSPLQYGYRTKLTPHFQAPPTGGKKRQWKGKGKGVEAPATEAAVESGQGEKEWEVTIGFEQKGRKRIIDIEECPIATKVINEQMTIEREKVKR
jgi:tRNA (uracil-5-)-methyltransferase